MTANSGIDRREYHLMVTEKDYNYNGLMKGYVDTVMQRIDERFTPDEVQTFARMLGVIADELMPETEM